MSKKLTLPMLLFGIFLTSACATQIPTPATSDYCVLAARIQFSRLHDTPETIRAVKDHNAVYDSVCGAPKP